MKKFLQNCSILLTLLLAAGACTTNDDSAVIQGSVFDAQSGSVIENALVQITAPGEYTDLFARTNENGQYNIGGIEVEGVTDLTLTASANGYNDLEDVVRITPGESISDVDFDLPIEGSGGDGGGGDDDGGDDDEEEISGEAGGPAQMELVNVSNPFINVAETGANTSTTFTFVVRDSAGRTVDRDHEVLFEIIRGPEGGEYITPETGLTNSEGRVTSQLVSGGLSGTVRIQAVIDRSDIGLTIRSTPVLISISNGFPVAENFNVGPVVYNFDAYGLISENHTNNITVSLGDEFGNPVKEGTTVWFSSEYGGLVNGSAATNANGYATVNMSANGSTPQSHPNGIGYIDVTAQTIDVNNNYIEKTMTMLITTPRAIISVTPNTFDVTNAGSQNFDVTITDLNGYPMAANTQISVTTGAGLVASGDLVDFQMPDAFDPGPGTTEFGVTISDSNPDEVVDTEGSFTITVVSPYGTVTTETIQGSRAKTSSN
ncbi:MAG: carboxypeptidase regulatory-like domain-containing protein [Gracilimonas sp.]